MENPGWDHILDEDEEILWQGRPDGGRHFNPRYLPGVIVGALFAGFALFWMITAARAGAGFRAFGLVYFGFGIGLILVPIFWAPYRRRHTWYTLTNRRAFIATDLPLFGKQLKSYPIDDQTVLELTPGEFSTLYFAKEVRRSNNGTQHVKPIGFEYIRDGEEVYRMMRDIQAGHLSGETGDDTG